MRDFITGQDWISIDGALAGLSHRGSLTGAGIFQSGSGIPADFGASGEVIYFETQNKGLWIDLTGGDSSDAIYVTGLETGTLGEDDVFVA